MNKNLKELLNIFMASFYIMNEKYTKEQKNVSYVGVFENIIEQYPELNSTLEFKIFNLGLQWANDLWDICEKIIAEEYGEYNDSTQEQYHKKYIQQYIDKYKEINQN